MRQILPHPLWLGHAGDGRDVPLILQSGVKAVVQLAEEEPCLELPRELLYCRYPLIDGAGNDAKVLYLAIVSVANLLERHVPTLVCCGAGMSRSPAVAAAAMSMVYQESPDDCLKQLAEHQPADVVPGFWEEAKQVARDAGFG